MKIQDLILEDKETLLKFFDNPKTVPSFIFYSESAGTGKTSTAKILEKEYGCDILSLNSSDERGIDVIRDKIKVFVQSLSTNKDFKRCRKKEETHLLMGGLWSSPIPVYCA